MIQVNAPDSMVLQVGFNSNQKRLIRRREESHALRYFDGHDFGRVLGHAIGGGPL